ncbi:MAG: RNA polymerase subunit sigma, partial [Fuerstiella sp.]
SGPIVRTGTNPKFWSNWDQAFGGGNSADSKAEKTGKSKKKADSKKVASPKAAKAAAPKADTKKAAKKKKKSKN